MSPFSPGQLGPLSLPNRVIKAATFEGMTPGGMPSAQLIEHHRAIAAGGTALTTVAYCAVARDGLTFADQMVMGPEIVPALRQLTDAVHKEGGAAALQLGHAGYFASPAVAGTRPLGASAKFCLYTLTRPRVASLDDLQRLTADFVRAARLAVEEAGFDAVELHLGHGYLLSQFLSPYTNRRRDSYGGSLQNRLRFPLEVCRGVKQALAEKAAVLAKVNLQDGFQAGLGIAEATEVAQQLEQAGIDALVLSGGFVSKTPFYMLRGELPVAEMARNEKKAFRRMGLRLFGRLMVPQHPFEAMFFLPDSRQIRKAVRLPLVLLGGIRSLAHMQQARQEGFNFISLGRPLIHDPDLIKKMKAGEIQSSPCEPCNKCVSEMESGGIRCTHPQLGTASNQLPPSNAT